MQLGFWIEGNVTVETGFCSPQRRSIQASTRARTRRRPSKRSSRKSRPAAASRRSRHGGALQQRILPTLPQTHRHAPPIHSPPKNPTPPRWPTPRHQTTRLSIHPLRSPSTPKENQERMRRHGAGIHARNRRATLACALCENTQFIHYAHARTSGGASNFLFVDNDVLIVLATEICYSPGAHVHRDDD